MLRLLSCSVVALVMALSCSAVAQPRRPAPALDDPAYTHPKTEPRGRGLLIAGPIVWTVGAVNATALSASTYRGAGYGAIPVVGPFIAAGELEPPPTCFLCFTDVARGLFVATGIAQLTGLALTVAGGTMMNASQDEPAALSFGAGPVGGPGGEVAGMTMTIAGAF